MEIKVNKLRESAIDPVVKNNVIELYSDKISTEVSKDGRICLVYETGISINIPEGSLGIILPVEETRLYSLELSVFPIISRLTLSPDSI